MSFGYDQQEVEGCSVRTCNNHQIQTYCTKDCPSTCAAGQRASFNLALCQWSCSCDTSKCISKGPKCPAGMKLANIVHEEGCCPFDDEKGYTCVCDEAPTCQPGSHSSIDPETGCHLPCEKVNVCPSVDFKECSLSGGTVIRVGPCQTCHHDQCQLSECSVSKSRKRISFGDYVSEGDVFETTCNGSCQSSTSYGDSECKICSPVQHDKVRVTLRSVLDSSKTRDFLISQVKECQCSTVPCDFATHAPKPAAVADSSSDSTSSQSDDSYYNY